MNRKTVQSIAIIAIFITGALLLFYPLVGNWWNERRYDMLVSGYTQRVQVSPSGEDYATEFKRIDAYNATLPGKGVPDAFAVTTPEEDAEYASFLNEDPNGVMAYINIPRLKSTLPIYHYTTPESLQKDVGHLRGSALPVGGKNTHAVLSAHRGLPTSRLFTDLDKVRKGDHFYITVLNRTLAYEVDRISVVKPDQTKELSVQPGKDLVTLVTCTPYGVNTQRLLVRGHRVPYNAAQAKHEAADSAVSSFTVYGFVATYGTLAIALAGIAVLRRNAAVRITPPIGRIASPSQSANKRRLASLTGSVIALPYFVPRKSVPGNKMRKGNDRRYPLLLTTYDFAYLWRDVRQKRRKNRRFIPPTMLCGTLFCSRLCQTGLNRKS